MEHEDTINSKINNKKYKIKPQLSIFFDQRDWAALE